MVLNYMENGYSEKLIKSYLELADDTLEGAYSNYNESRFRVATSLAYYAMFYCANGAIVNAGAKPPKTHRSVISEFSRYYVKTGKLDSKFSKYLSKAMDSRQVSSYNILADISKKDTLILLGNAKEFIRIVKKAIILK